MNITFFPRRIVRRVTTTIARIQRDYGDKKFANWRTKHRKLILLAIERNR